MNPKRLKLILHRMAWMVYSNTLLRVLFTAILFGWGHLVSQGQNDTFASGKVGTRIFIDTDQADTSFLEELKSGFYRTQIDTQKLALINDLAYYWHTRNLDSSFTWTFKGIELATQFDNDLWHGRLLITLGAVLLRNEQLDSAEQVLNQAKSMVLRSDLPFLFTQMGYVKERKGLLAEAADQVLSSLEIANELDDKKAIALAYSDFSNLFWKQAKLDEALSYGLRSLNIFQERNIQDLDYSFTLYVVGNIYLSQKNYPQALAYFERSNAMSEKYGFYNNLCDTYISLTDLYTEIKKYEEATKASKLAIEYGNLLNNNFLLMRSWLSIAKLQNLQNDCHNAIESLNTCLTIATDDFGDDFYLQQVYFELAHAYALCQNYGLAYRAFQSYDHHRNSFFTAEADRRISQLETEFKVAQKEATISDQEAKLHQQRKLQIASIGIVILLITVLIIIFYNSINNRKKNAALADLNKDLELKNRELDQRNTDKEILLKEIHHRVKNNLEIVVSLLELQMSRIDDPEIQNVMLASQNRVQSIGIVHQKLYQGNNLGMIAMKEYFIHLIKSISDSFDVGDHISFVCEMEELEIDIDTAIPIGLIINELLTNAIKHAFPYQQSGIIKIGLSLNDDGFLDLFYHDNGIGKQQSAASSGTGFGTNLIHLLTRQLDGTIQEKTVHGTEIRFQFKKVNVFNEKAG